MLQKTDSELAAVIAVMSRVMTALLTLSIPAFLFTLQYEGARDSQLWGGAQVSLVTAIVFCAFTCLILSIIKIGSGSEKAKKIGGVCSAYGLGACAAGLVLLLMSLSATLGGVAYLCIMVGSLLTCWVLIDIQRSKVEVAS